MTNENPGVSAGDIAGPFQNPPTSNYSPDQVFYEETGAQAVVAGLELSVRLAQSRSMRPATPGRLELLQAAILRCGCTPGHRRELVEFGRRLDLLDVEIDRLMLRLCGLTARLDVLTERTR